MAFFVLKTLITVRGLGVISVNVWMDLVISHVAVLRDSLVHIVR